MTDNRRISRADLIIVVAVILGLLAFIVTALGVSYFSDKTAERDLKKATNCIQSNGDWVEVSTNNYHCIYDGGIN